MCQDEKRGSDQIPFKLLMLSLASKDIYLTSEIDGTIPFKSYLMGSPDIRLALNEEFPVIGLTSLIEESWSLKAEVTMKVHAEFPSSIVVDKIMVELPVPTYPKSSDESDDGAENDDVDESGDDADDIRGKRDGGDGGRLDGSRSFLLLIPLSSTPPTSFTDKSFHSILEGADDVKS
ncbi:hypothetical protein M0R45_008787 [Rubus argutus]|uniref:Uncharacterized protein n=1 Tax=Rubus argutus TaxID=59490 RepID=A0AAW1Y4R1_RUBAR